MIEKMLSWITGRHSLSEAIGISVILLLVLSIVIYMVVAALLGTGMTYEIH